MRNTTDTHSGQLRKAREIGVMDEGNSLGRQFQGDLPNVAFQYIQLGVDQGIKSEDEITRTILYHFKTQPIVHVVLDQLVRSEALPTNFNAFVGKVDNAEPFAVVLQILGPPTVSWCYLQNMLRG